MTANEIRRSFLGYFERQRHRVVSSSPLVPHDDPTLLFTNAGMNQFKDVFLGRDTREYKRAATAQKCMRVSGKHNDLDNVGPSLRHHTFFEMLGNFSFGDYFKREAIPFAWTLLTTEWKLDPTRLHATIFSGETGIPRDDEAYDVWRTFLPAERVGELGSADNFWQMGDTGPCGRCSEIYYFRGGDLPCAEEASGRACRGMECSCDRFIEIWNNVFMEFDRQSDGVLKPLPAPSIDTGMGLERVTAVMQGHLSNYDTDLFTPLLAAIGEHTNTRHGGTHEATDVSMRVVADHMRAMTFLIADGVAPSNEWRGYVLRKIMRRAMRHGKRLGMTQPFLHALVDTLVAEFGGAYPELVSGRNVIVQVVKAEEERFDAVLTGGLPRLEEVLDRAAASGGVVSGESAFRLYDTFGLPQEFIEDMIDDRRLSFDRDGFNKAMERQRETARAKSAFKTTEKVDWIVGTGGLDSSELTGSKDTFTGYEAVRAETTVLALFNAGREQVASLSAGETGYVVLKKTPFYVEAGGQVSDRGTIAGAAGSTRVEGLERMPTPEWPRAHRVVVDTGTLRHGDIVTASVDASLRDATRRNHTATHLLHAALRQVLGAHVKQAGSLVAPDRLRFDFVHFSPVTLEERARIEHIVNEEILRNAPVQTEVRNTEEAIAAGAMALFGEKYGDSVRVVSIPGFSVELCGGTHVRATGDIGLFAIVSEGGVAAGVRRIEAITGMASLKAFQWNREVVGTLAQTLNTRAEDLVAKVEATADENKRLARDLQQTRMKAAMSGATSVNEDVTDIGGVKLMAREVGEMDKDGLRALVDQHRARLKSGVVVLASPANGKVIVVVGVTPDLTKRVPAGQVVKQLAPIVGGGGGGRADFAEAGGKEPSKIAEMLAASRGVVEKLLST